MSKSLTEGSFLSDSSLVRPDLTEELAALLRDRIVILDGAMGTAIQRDRPDEAGYRGERFKDWPSDVIGNNDLLTITQPQIIAGIHREYLESGADIIETNTFNANGISLADYGMEELAYELNVEAAKLARRECDAMTERTPDRKRYVAGALGPTTRTASISPDVNDPGARNVGYEQLLDAYLVQARGLVDGGADLLVVETIFDTLNAKAAIFALETLFEERGRRWPVVVSGTITDASGRTLSGQVTEAFWNSVRHARPLAVGLNCALGAGEMRPYLAELARVADCFVSAYPNAGLPNAFGEYDETPDQTAAVLEEFAASGMVNLLGGCCGTTPPHIAAIAKAAEGHKPRTPGTLEPSMRLSGLEPVNITEESLFVNVGERTNITGSARFRNLIKAGDYPTALSVARQQVEAGAQVIDVNMDEGMIDGVAAMDRFTKLIASEPDICRVPVMIDSSKWEVIEAGLRNVQGKPIVNSISLKEGEEKFVEQARLCRKYGAAVVVMAFDEDGQADNLERRKEICRRAYRILTEEVGLPAEDIVFDPNVFAVATGIEEHSTYGVDFIEATRWIKQNLPGALVSGGISNVSFSFRGNNPVREAIHAVFLYHAIQAGLDMGIVNAGALVVYDEIDAELRERIEDVVLNRRADATERLLEIATELRRRRLGQGDRRRGVAQPAGGRAHHARPGEGHRRVRRERHRGAPAGDLGSRRPSDRGHRGSADGRHERRRRPVRSGQDVPPAGGQVRSGDEEGRGLPHPVHRGGEAARRRCARQGQDRDGHGQGRRARHRQEHRGRRAAVQQLRRGRPRRDGARPEDPRHRQGRGSRHHRPVRPDHAVVGRDGQPRGGDGAPGLRHPAAHRWCHDSRAHTAVKVDPKYHGPVVWVKDASRSVPVAAQLLSDEQRPKLLEDTKADYDSIRERHAQRLNERPMLSLERARRAAPQIDWSTYKPPRPHLLSQQSKDVWSHVPDDKHGRATQFIKTFTDYNLDELRKYIDWQPFFNAWEMKGSFPDILNNPASGEAARKLYDDAQRMLDQIVDEKWLRANGVIGLFPANRLGDDDIEVYADESRTDGAARRCTTCASRASTVRVWRTRRCRTSWRPEGHPGLHRRLRCHRRSRLGDEDQGVQGCPRRLQRDPARVPRRPARRGVRRASARAGPHGVLGLRARRAPRQRGADQGAVRRHPARPRLPGLSRPHREGICCGELLDVETRTGIELTESMAMWPGAAVSGWYFSHPQSQYFVVGRIGQDQVADYARRKGWTMAEAERWLAPNLAYEPED